MPKKSRRVPCTRREGEGLHGKKRKGTWYMIELATKIVKGETTVDEHDLKVKVVVWRREHSHGEKCSGVIGGQAVRGWKGCMIIQDRGKK